jgi:hypothetical protein
MTMNEICFSAIQILRKIQVNTLAQRNFRRHKADYDKIANTIRRLSKEYTRICRIAHLTHFHGILDIEQPILTNCHKYNNNSQEDPTVKIANS